MRKLHSVSAGKKIIVIMFQFKQLCDFEVLNLILKS